MALILQTICYFFALLCITCCKKLMHCIDAKEKTFIFYPFRKIAIASLMVYKCHQSRPLLRTIHQPLLASQNEVLESRKIARCDIQMGLDFSMSRAQEVVPFPRICYPIMLTFPKRETRPPPLHTRKCVEPLNTILLFLKNIISCFLPEKCFLSIPYLGK